MKIILPKLLISIERWKYNSRCQTYVSTLGRFKNSKGELLEPKVGHRHGYLHVYTICGWECCHRLVMETWKPKKDMITLTVDHLNHNKRDNRLCNLEWVTLEENLLRAEKDCLIQQESKELNMGSPIIMCSGQRFTSFDSVAKWLLDNKKISSYTDINKKTIKKGIMKSIKNNTRYCNYFFTIE